MNRKDKNHLGTDKISMYGWKIKDEPGDLEWIDKNLIQVDRSYQRETNSQKVIRIARDWSWIAFGAVIVAIRQGAYYAIDGQHRVEAAMRRSDIKKIPCIVFKTSGEIQEAEGFLTAQTQRKAVTAVEKFKALVLIKNKEALLVQRLVSMSGRSVSSGSGGPNYISCVSLLLKAAGNRPTELVKIWPLILEVCQGETLHSNIAAGLLYIETNLPNTTSLTHKRWHDRVVAVGYHKLIDGANKAAAMYSKGGEKVWAIGMIEAINYRAKNRLELEPSRR
jgi:hypothetical protein